MNAPQVCDGLREALCGLCVGTLSQHARIVFNEPLDQERIELAIAKGFRERALHRSPAFGTSQLCGPSMIGTTFAVIRPEAAALSLCEPAASGL
jgi:hypothetical protein